MSWRFHIHTTRRSVGKGIWNLFNLRAWIAFLLFAGGGRAWIAFVTLITRILLNVVFFTTKLDRDFTLSSLFLALRAGWSWRLAYAPQISIILSNLVTNFSNCNFRAICKKILKRTYFWFKSERMLACT